MKILTLATVTALVLSFAVEARSKTPPTPNGPAKASSACEHDEKTFRCVRYVKNYDADTITVDIPGVHPLIGKKVSVRVRHIDTPEIKGKLPCEKEAARTAQRLVENLLKNAKKIDLVDVDRDKYFRILADVIVDGDSIKDILLRNQFAYPYEGETKRKMNWCRDKGTPHRSVPKKGDSAG